MQLGIFETSPTVDGLITAAESAAEAGYGSFWTPQIFELDALTALAVVGRAVPEIRLGTAVIPTFPRHPMALAQQALTVTQLIGDRLDLGIGLSHQLVVEGMWGISFDRPVGHMRDYLSILVPLLTEQKASHTGELVTGRGEIGVTGPRPAVYVAALGAQMLRLTGRLADGTVTWMTGPATIETLTAPTITAAAEEAGRPAPAIIASVPVCLTDDVAGARERAATELAIYGQLPSYRAMLDREGLTGPADLVVAGDQEAVRTGLQRFADAGATQIVVAPFGRPDEVAVTRDAVAELIS